jgi:hypothetical protein
MDADERALKILEEFARVPRETGPVALSQEYLDHIARVESQPQNQTGADKTARHKSQSEFLSHFRRVRRL